MPSLFDPIHVGAIEAKNRVWMSPLTRGRATRDHVPTPIMKEYYEQRASAGFIISEATGVSQEGLGWPYAPGLWSQQQVEAWKPITAAVHAKGGKIVSQLWHMGHAVHNNVTGMQPVAPNDYLLPGQIHTYNGKLDPGPARALSKDDIARTIDDFGKAAANAIEAGFDLVEVHGANGYLIDAFLKDTNKRTDEYGGSVENRLRFLKEVMDRVIATVGADRTGICFSPNGETMGVFAEDPESIFVPAVKYLSEKKVAFIELREPGVEGTFGQSDQPKLHSVLRPVFDGVLVLNQDYTREGAIDAVANGTSDAITFGRPFIANPDLPYRIEKNISWNKPNMQTLYSQTREGYIDYPAATAPSAL